MRRLKHTALRIGLLSLVSSLAWPAGFLKRATEAEVNIVVDLTPDGRKLPPPSREKPIYYYPVTAGYREMGARVTGETRPAAAPVARLLAKALAAQGYLVITDKTPPPSIVLVFHWGYLNPQIDDASGSYPPDDDPSLELPRDIFWNQDEMLRLVTGQAKGDSVSPFERDDILEAARENRYFVLVSAFDFDAASRKQKKLLWLARMSTPANNVTLAEVLPTMINSGGAFFGRETERKAVMAPIARDGKVELGTPVVVEDAGPQTPPDGTGSGKK